MLREGSIHRDLGRAYVAAGLAACAVLAVTDAVNDSVVLIPLLVLAPLIAAGGSYRGTLFVAVVSAAMSLPLGWIDGIGGSRQHLAGIVTTLLGGGIVVIVAGARAARDREFADSLPIMRRADRLKAALATGRMGEWSWDRATGAVTWDSNVATLFGLGDAQFGGTFDEWIGNIDERDRAMVQAAVADGVAKREPFRFDHRCIWSDGSVHWIEGIGDVLVSGITDEVIGAFGLAIDVDERHREVEEHTRLLELERRQRERAEYLARVNDVLAYSLDQDEIVQRVTHSVVPELADWCSIVISVDRRRDRPSITVAHQDPQRVAWAEQFQRDFPYDPDVAWGAAGVIRTGRSEFIPVVDPAVFELLGGDVLADLGLRSVITVPLIGALGTIGAMQVVRRDGRAAFEQADLELIEELAARAGGALNSAVLFNRQSRGRAALDTLQQVNGRIASFATTDKIINAALTYGSAGIGADAAVMFLVDSAHQLAVMEETAVVDEQTRAIELAVANQALQEGSVVVVEPSSGTAKATVGVPLRIMNRTVGTLVFTFMDYRDFSPEELSMLVTLGSRCAGALERASLYERDRDIALTFQRRLMPALPIVPEWIAIAACYQPASGLAIGGDWYQVLDVDGGGVAAVVGDAVGHGLVAAAAMGQLRASIATAVANDAEPNHAMAAVDLFAVQGADTIGASLAYVLFDPAGPARYASAGHVPVVLVPANKPCALLEGGRRPLLGFRTSQEHDRTADFEFGKDDIVVMFTDGLVERRGETIDDGLDRLLEAIERNRGLDPQAMCSALLEQLTDGHESEDDIAVLVIRRN
ncbi:MAG: SpoIIE family protein phosphatase [Ilumatobacteraceae bacterium]